MANTRYCMAAAKTPDFDSVEYDSPDVLAEDAWVAAEEEAYDAACRDAAGQLRQQLVARHAVEACISSCLESLSALYVSREAHALSDIALSYNNWNQEPEPEPCSRDAWLRGAIPEEPAPKPIVISTPTTPGPKPNSSSSSRDRPSSTHAQRKGTSIAGSDTPSNRRITSPLTRSVTPPQPQKAAVAAATSTSSSSKRTKQLTPEQKEAEDNLRQELQIRRQQEALLKSLKQKDEEARAQLATLQKEIKGKEYTYGHNGQVILINRPNPEHLPGPPAPHVKVAAPASSSSPGGPGSPRAGSKQQGRRSSGGGTSPRSTTKSGAAAAAAPDAAVNPSSPTASLKRTKPSNAAAAAAAGGGGARDQASKNSTPRTGPGGAAGGATAKKDYIEVPSRAQPPVLEVVKPSLGVTLRVGNSTKLGPKTDPNQASRPTRQQFQQQAKSQQAKLQLKQQQQVMLSSAGAFPQQQQQQQQQLATQLGSVAGRSAAGGGGGGLGGRSCKSFLSPALADAATTSSNSRNYSVTGAGSSSSGSGGVSKATNSRTTLDLLATMPDTAVGGLPLNAVLKSASGTISNSGSSSSGGGGGSKAQAVRVAGPDVNLALTSAADWGQVTGGGYEPPELKQVARPGEKQLQEEGKKGLLYGES